MTQKEHDEKVMILRVSLVEAEKQIQDIRKELDELDKVQIEPESRRWKPNRGQIYYLISDTGSVTYTTWYNSNDDLLRFTLGNVFKTKEEAEFVVERFKVIAELKEFAEPDDRKWNSLDYHYGISYNYNKGGFDIDAWCVMRSDSIHFESKDKAREAIEAVGEDRIKKYYFQVKRGE